MTADREQTRRDAARKLHPAWVSAAQRRLHVRALRAAGHTFRAIGERVGVSSEQARRDWYSERMSR